MLIITNLSLNGALSIYLVNDNDACVGQLNGSAHLRALLVVLHDWAILLLFIILLFINFLLYLSNYYEMTIMLMPVN